jgi:hypothetical protein
MRRATAFFISTHKTDRSIRPPHARPTRMHAVARSLLPNAAVVFAALASFATARAESPFATSVVSYTAGTGAVAGFTNPTVALGAPERFTGEGIAPGCVTPFQPAFRPNEIVSLGVGGSLVVAFDHEVRDDARNPFGVDLLVFSNAFFSEMKAGAGVAAGLVSEGGTISISADGTNWTVVPNLAAESLFPTLGYLDATPYANAPGLVPSDFLRPVDPSIAMADLVGLPYEELVARYDGSGGGTGIDIGALGFASIRFVRFDGPLVSGFSPEIDAVADVAALPPDADLDGDGGVGAADLATLLARWGTSDAAADLDADGIVGAADLAAMLAAWTGGGA